MERFLIVGIETEAGRHLARRLTPRADILGVPFSAGTLIPAGRIRRLPRTTPDSVRLLLETDSVSHVIYCGQASQSGWSSGGQTTNPCSDTAELQAWSIACAQAGNPFVFISSDTLFEGPWVFHDESSESVAETALAQSIRQQEAIVAELEDALIIRTHVCGFAPQSLLTYRLLLETAAPALDRRWYATPIYAGRFARLLVGLIEREATGLFHLGGGERISHSQFLSQLEERFHPAANPTAIPNHGVRQECSALRETSLRSSKARRLLKEGLPTISDFLDDVAGDLASGAACELAGVSITAPSRVA